MVGSTVRRRGGETNVRYGSLPDIAGTDRGVCFVPITDTGQRSDRLLGDALPLYESLQEHIRRSAHFVTEALIELAGVGPACLGGKRHRVAILGPGDLLYPPHKQAADTQAAQRDVDH